MINIIKKFFTSSAKLVIPLWCLLLKVALAQGVTSQVIGFAFVGFPVFLAGILVAFAFTFTICWFNDFLCTSGYLLFNHGSNLAGYLYYLGILIIGTIDNVIRA